MYAIVQTGGRQFRAQPDETLKIPRIEASVGDMVELEEILLVTSGEGVRIGRPTVEGAKVVAEVTAQGRDEKILVFHKKRRKRFQKRNGHRQPFTEVRIKEIVT